MTENTQIGSKKLSDLAKTRLVDKQVKAATEIKALQQAKLDAEAVLLERFNERFIELLDGFAEENIQIVSLIREYGKPNQQSIIRLERIIDGVKVNEYDIEFNSGVDWRPDISVEFGNHSDSMLAEFIYRKLVYSE